MLIGIDGNEANVKNRVGSNIFAFELLKHLERKKTSDEFTIYLREQPLGDLPKNRIGWNYKIFGPKKFWTQFALPLNLYLSKKRPDIFFTPGHYAPRFCPVPLAISILDISYLLFPKYFRKRDLFQLQSWSSYSIRNAKIIFTISNSTKKDIVHFYKIKEDKIKVIYPSFDKDRFKEKLSTGKSQEVINKYKIKKPYILFVGTIQPRKNLVNLIKAFKNICVKNNDINLVIAGKTGWLYKEIFEETKGTILENRIKLTGYALDEDLPFFYKEASCFILPSLYEGFGIPVLEAMAVGCPVIVSINSSLSEITGENGILIDPYSVKSITNGLEKALTLNPVKKENIIKQGLIKAKQFSWEKCVEEILSVLKTA